jgi:hypothetical protein
MTGTAKKFPPDFEKTDAVMCLFVLMRAARYSAQV